MEHEQMKALAQAHGFACVYCLCPQPLGETWAALYRERPPHTQALCLDPTSAYPWASALVLLVRAYRPFLAETGLPGYYIASNAGYHAANAMCAALCEAGYRAQRLEVPLPALVLQAGIGTLCKNAMLDLPGLGTRTVLYTIVTDACAPETDFPRPPAPCGACALCVNACPASAIHPGHGLEAVRCLRTYMEGDPMPIEVMERLPGLLGCEICQSACPRNAKIQPRAATEEELAAFDIPTLLRSVNKAARMLVGKNMCSRSRLTAQAAVLAAKRGQYGLLADIRGLLTHPQPAVREAAVWAAEILQKK